MKVVWIISAEDGSVAKLQSELEKASSSYLVRHSKKIGLIPDIHLKSKSVAVMIDSFHLEHQGFEGLKTLRQLNFPGQIYIFGEPAPEKTMGPFTDLELNGFFPAIERADLSYVAGILHHSFELKNNVNHTLFLNKENKSGSAKIKTQNDLDQISSKLSVFGSRFGTSEERIKKTIMGLCMSHVQTKHGQTQIADEFEILFGTDRSKIVLCVPIHSKANDTKTIRNEFSQALKNFHTSELNNSVLFQEFHHLVKAANNLSVLGGSSKEETDLADPLFLITRIQLGSPETKNANGYYFSINHVKPSEDLTETDANAPLKADDGKTSQKNTSNELKATVTSHSEKDLEEILNEPVVVGDTPEKKGEKISLTASIVDNDKKNKVLSEEETVINKNLFEKIKSELNTQKEINELLSLDVHRLMQERKEPALDTELKKQNEELKQKLENQEKDFSSALESLTKQIEELKTKGKEGDKKKAA